MVIKILIPLLFILAACSAMPDILKTVDDVFDDAIRIRVDKAALQKDTDVNISVDVKNKNPPEQ